MTNVAEMIQASNTIISFKREHKEPTKRSIRLFKFNYEDEGFVQLLPKDGKGETK